MAFDKSDFEQYPSGMAMDETDVNLRTYFSRMPDEKVDEYDPNWTDERVLQWEPNFTNEETLMLVCSERDVTVGEYRKVLEQYIEFRSLHASES